MEKATLNSKTDKGLQKEYLSAYPDLKKSSLVVAGGVAANKTLRKELENLSKEYNIEKD